MKLDSNEQRTLLLQCVGAAELSGQVKELMPLMTNIGNLITAVQKAELDIQPTKKKEKPGGSDRAAEK